ncbi:MAG: SO_0444 family Cu/Zn efflux transporter [Rikenellaceae bacterium]
MEYFNELLMTLNEMSPYLMLGFLISGLLHVYVPNTLYSRFLNRKGFRSVLGAAALGVPLPLCSCGVIPTSVSLKKDGASDGATVAFLVGTPQTGIDSILATYSLLGLPFAIFRPIAAFIVAIFSGLAVDKFGTKKEKRVNFSKFQYIPTADSSKSQNSCCCGDSHSHSHSHTSSCGCSHEQKVENVKTLTPAKRFIAALEYGYVHLLQDFGKWLIIGLLVAAAITAFIPDSLFTLFKEYYFLNILLILLISTPMYICATGSIPVALSLILKGVSPGAAFVLLMAGPATNFASLIILKREIGVRKCLIYLLSIILGAVVCALIIDFILPEQWFSDISLHETISHHHHDHDHCHEHGEAICTHGPFWFQTTTSIMFIALFINSMVQKWRKKGGCKSC